MVPFISFLVGEMFSSSDGGFLSTSDDTVAIIRLVFNVSSSGSRDVCFVLSACLGDISSVRRKN